MEEKHLFKVYSINPQGQLCIDGQELDSDIILFEEDAIRLLESELLDGLLLYYPEDEEDYSNIEEEEEEGEEEYPDLDVKINSKVNEVIEPDDDYFDSFSVNYP